jgi:hypothetical protein
VNACALASSKCAAPSKSTPPISVAKSANLLGPEAKFSCRWYKYRSRESRFFDPMCVLFPTRLMNTTLLCSLLLFAGTVESQELPAPPHTDSEPADSKGQAPEASSATPIRTQVNLATIPVIVRDSKSHPVEDLKKENFQVFDNGKLQ